MFWIIAIISSYFCFALASIGDKIILSGPSKPKSYTFFVGLLGIIVVFLIPFMGLVVPHGIIWLWIILSSFFYIIGLYSMFIALENFDVSKIIPTIGALQPIFIIFFSFLLWEGEIMNGNQIVAFVVLLLGGVLISIEKEYKLTQKSLQISLLAAIFFSLQIVFSKLVFLEISFWDGFIWMKIFSFLFVMGFLLKKAFRKDIFKIDGALNKKTGIIFLNAQICGGIANILESWAVFLVPLAYLGIMNAMKGIQYVFIFIFAMVLSYFFPKLLKETSSKRIVIQKIIAIILILVGLRVLFL